MYLVVVCPLLLLVAGGLALARRSRPAGRVVGALAVVAVVGYGARTFAYQEAYRDNLAIWRHEATLEHPAVLALQALAKDVVARAQAAPPGPERDRWVAEGRAAIARGLAVYATFPAEDGSYRKFERLFASAMHVLLGTLARLEGQPLEVEIAHYERGQSIAISARTAVALADGYLRLAGPRPPTGSCRRGA